jgi:Na/Pi-cotransporter
MVLLAGCDDRGGVKIDSVRVFQGAEQCALPGRAFESPLVVEVSGKSEKGWFGGEIGRPPAAGAHVFFQLQDGSDLTLSAQEATADDSGLVRLNVTAGRRIGDQYLRVIPADAPDKAITVRFATGVEIRGAGQECRAGSVIPEPLTVKLAGSDGAPAAGVPVYFKIVSAPSAEDTGVLTRATAVTDSDGEARTFFRLGNETGRYDIQVEIGGQENGMFFTRGVAASVLGYDVMALIINTLGGLAVLVFGMKVMSDGLQKAAGEHMRNILHYFSRNRCVGILAGALAAAAVQSSSASTVMVIGFVNAGLLNLVQSIGIIFGANIGTTVTAQVISFNIGWIAMPAIVAGLAVMFVSQRFLRGWGETVLGFGFLFFGMNLMSDSLKTVAGFPGFVRFFSTFDCAPVGGWMPPAITLGVIGIGMAAAIIIQSSSAVTAVILALGAGGLLNLYTAVPLVLGANAGTTVTALLAAIPTNRIGRQAAVAHAIFNIVGAGVIFGSFYLPVGGSGKPVFFALIDYMTAGNAFAAVPQNLTRHIANAHTMFNVITAVLLVPFIAQIAAFCEWLIPVRNDKVKYKYLEPYLLDTPSIALEQSVRALCHMVRESWSMVGQAVNEQFLKSDIDEAKFRALAKREDRIDELQMEVTEYLVQITRRELSEPQSELIPLLMHCTNDAERIADHTANILTLTTRLHDAAGNLSERGRNDLAFMNRHLAELAKSVLEALESGKSEYVDLALEHEEEINRLAVELEAAHIERLRLGLCDAIVGVIYIELIGELEKVADHLTNIAERAEAIQQHYIDMGRERSATASGEFA